MLKLRTVSLLGCRSELDALPKGKLLINTINAHSYNTAQRDTAFAEALLKGDALIPDGASIVLAFKFLRHKKIERIAGWDLFLHEMNKLNRKGGTCFFLGSNDDTLRKIKVKAVRLYPNIQVETYSPPYKAEFSEKDNQQMIEAVNRVNPDLLWVGMTAPKQEKWAYTHLKELNVNGIPYKVQFNPARIVSSGAKVDAKSIQERKCFLCPANLPPVQKGIPFGGHYHILVNPFPIFPRHLTIPELAHTPQRIASRFTDMLELAEALTDYTIFYNGPKCGASAPDHAHFQAGNKGFMPIEKDWRGQTAGKIADYRKAALWYLDDAPRATLVIESTSKEDAADLFDIIYRSLDVKPEEDEPMMNVLVLYEADRWVVFVFPREKHRPACYTAEGEANLLSSPASVDLGGVFITPVEKDFLKITAEDVAQILSEVCLSATDFHKVRQRIREKI